jgi:dGTPase
VPAYAEILDTVETQFPGAMERERFLESIRHLLDGLASGLIEGTVAAVRAAGLTNFESVRAHPVRVARFSAEAMKTSAEIKRCLFANVYSTAALEADRKESGERLTRMFGYLMLHPDLVPGALDGAKPFHRAVCDFIAGMTDRYFFRVYAQLFSEPRT